MSSQTDALKAGRSDSLGRRPAIANAITPGTPGGNTQYTDRRAMGNAARIKMSRIEADPTQPRKSFPEESLTRLADNMRIRGQLVPILVRWCPEVDRYRVIDGERRFRAAQLAGLLDMACVVEDEADPDTILELQLIANALREDVQPVEQAKAWERLRASQGLTLRELGAKLGYDYSTVSRGLDLLKLDPTIQARVDAGELPASTAGQIARIDDHAEQIIVADRAVAENMNRADVAAAVKAKTTRAKGKAKIETSRTFKSLGGYQITVERPKGIDLTGLAEALDQFASKIKAEVGTTE